MAELTQAKLKEQLKYDPETGLFSWIGSRCPKCPPGKIAGTRHKASGYWVIRIGERLYRAHRLAWLYVNGEWPAYQIDHINGIRDDNRIANLRLASNAENARNSKKQSNNTSGQRGVAWHSQRKKWQAYINFDGKRHSLGLHDDIEDASRAYQTASKKYFGEFARAA
jgi:hypothetical protein